MVQSYDLTQLDEGSFEHLVNFLALKVLGAGHTGFGPGADGGRDGYFEGEARYPSDVERWSGRWYIQAKFHRPHLSTDPQKWILEQISRELEMFARPDTRRVWPDNWIIVTNVDVSGVPQTGAFDRARGLVSDARRSLASRFHIWGGRKVLDLLALHPSVADYYGHFLTPGHVLKQLYDRLGDDHAEVKDIVRYLAVGQFTEQQHTKLEQAGSAADNRPGIHKLFTDLPFTCQTAHAAGMAAQYIASSISQNHRVTGDTPEGDAWSAWRRHPKRARIWFVRGGPGQGKSTVGQYISQIQRAALILEPDGPSIAPAQRSIAREVRQAATQAGLWPVAPRIPTTIELKDFAQWFGWRAESEGPKGVLTYLTDRIGANLEQTVHAGTLRRAFNQARWLFVFDGLDEVPSDVKNKVAAEVTSFIDDVLVGCESDAFVICTSRPQGYAGQFDILDAAQIELSSLSREQALACAKPVLEIDRSAEESRQYYEILSEALLSPSIQEIMTTPLQAHIMAVVVRDGGRPPERKWQLFTNFYLVIKKREANRRLPDKRLAALLREGDKLLKALHNRLGFELHARAEASHGATTSLNRKELRAIVRETVSELQETEVDETVETLMEATTQRLVLVSTPESGEQVRFDIRPLQEFFAAEYVYESVDSKRLAARIAIIAGDSHWREVMHFLLSALVENTRQTDLVVAVNALSVINNGTADDDLRLLSRRFAFGGIVAARILQEGVLEQDRRIRHQFRESLEPLFASTDTDLLRSLVSVSRVQSRAWLIDVLADSLIESAESENIGAAYVLAEILPDGHRRTKSVFDRLQISSKRYQACLFEMMVDAERFDEDDEDDEVSERYSDSSEWPTRLAFHALASEDWADLGKSGVDAALSLLHRRKTEVSRFAAEMDFSETLSPLWEALLLGVDQTTRWGGGEPPISEERVANFLQIETFGPPSALRFSEWDDSFWIALRTLPGIFALLSPIFELAKLRSPASIEALRRAVEPDLRKLRYLPYRWRTFLPKELAEDQPFPWPKKIDWSYVPGAADEITFDGKVAVTAAEWDLILKRLPYLAMHVFGEAVENGRSKQGYLATDEATAKLVKMCKRQPNVLLVYPEHWGTLVERCGRSSPAFRRLLISSTKSQTPDVKYARPISAFELRLPQEGSLLPYVAATVASAIDPQTFSFQQMSGRRQGRLIPDAMQAFCPDFRPLREIAGNHKLSGAIRGAAAFLFMMHAGPPSNEKEEMISTIVDCYTSEQGPWYLKAAVLALRERVNKGERGAMVAVGKLLDLARDNYLDRLAIDRALSRWREMSHAPVSSVGMADF